MNPLGLALVVSVCGFSGDPCIPMEGGLPVPVPVLFAQAPAYTELAKRALIEGQEWVVATVRPDGTIEAADYIMTTAGCIWKETRPLNSPPPTPTLPAPADSGESAPSTPRSGGCLRGR